MCIAIYKPEGTKLLTPDTFQTCWNSNPDGYGAIIRKQDDTIEVYKSLSMKKAKKHFQSVQTDPDTKDIAFHFRYATHGTNDINNCHPFDAGNGFQIVHNGILPLDDINNIKSDTALFAEYLQGMTLDAYNNHITIRVLEDFTQGSKVIMMRSDRTIILNETSGIEEDGIWYSNSGYKSYPYMRAKGKMKYDCTGCNSIEQYNYSIDYQEELTERIDTLISEWYLSNDSEEKNAIQDEMEELELELEEIRANIYS